MIKERNPEFSAEGGLALGGEAGRVPTDLAEAGFAELFPVGGDVEGVVSKPYARNESAERHSSVAVWLTVTKRPPGLRQRARLQHMARSSARSRASFRR